MTSVLLRTPCWAVFGSDSFSFLASFLPFNPNVCLILFWPFPRGCLDIYSVLISFNSSPVYLSFPSWTMSSLKTKRCLLAQYCEIRFLQSPSSTFHFCTKTLNFALLCTRSYAWSHRQKQRGISHGILKSLWRKLRYICNKAHKYCAKETEGRDWFWIEGKGTGRTSLKN